MDIDAQRLTEQLTLIQQLNTTAALDSYINYCMFENQVALLVFGAFVLASSLIFVFYYKKYKDFDEFAVSFSAFISAFLMVGFICLVIGISIETHQIKTNPKGWIVSKVLNR